MYLFILLTECSSNFPLRWTGIYVACKGGWKYWMWSRNTLHVLSSFPASPHTRFAFRRCSCFQVFGKQQFEDWPWNLLKQKTEARCTLATLGDKGWKKPVWKLSSNNLSSIWYFPQTSNHTISMLWMSRLYDQISVAGEQPSGEERGDCLHPCPCGFLGVSG